MPKGTNLSPTVKKRILDLAAQNLTYPVIAARLGVDKRTVTRVVGQPRG